MVCNPVGGVHRQMVKSKVKVTLPVLIKDTGYMVEFLIVSAPSPTIA